MTHFKTTATVITSADKNTTILSINPNGSPIAVVVKGISITDCSTINVERLVGDNHSTHFVDMIIPLGINSLTELDTDYIERKVGDAMIA